jgi:hypothetical protein
MSAHASTRGVASTFQARSPTPSCAPPPARRRSRAGALVVAAHAASSGRATARVQRGSATAGGRVMAPAAAVRVLRSIRAAHACATARSQAGGAGGGGAAADGAAGGEARGEVRGWAVGCGPARAGRVVTVAPDGRLGSFFGPRVPCAPWLRRAPWCCGDGRVGLQLGSMGEKRVASPHPPARPHSIRTARPSHGVATAAHTTRSGGTCSPALPDPSAHGWPH